MTSTPLALVLPLLLVASIHVSQPVSIEPVGPDPHGAVPKRIADEKSLVRAVQLRYSKARGLVARVTDSTWRESPDSRVFEEKGEYDVVVSRPDSILIRWSVIDAKGSRDTGEVSFLSGKGHVETNTGKSESIASLDEAFLYAIGNLDNAALVLPELFFEAFDRRLFDCCGTQLVFGADQIVDGEPCYTLLSRSADVDGVRVEMSISIERLLLLRTNGRIQRDDGSVSEYSRSFVYQEFTSK